MEYFQRPDNIKKNELMGPHELLLRKNRSLFLYGIIAPIMLRSDAYSSMYTQDMILALDAQEHAPIKLYIDSPGGYVSSGFTLFDTMREVSKIGSEIHTYGRSCQSMAVLILAAGTKGHRYVYKNTRIMLHLPSGNAEGDSDDIALQSKEINKNKSLLIDNLIECGATKSSKQILKDINKEYWMGAEEAIDYGIADKIV